METSNDINTLSDKEIILGVIDGKKGDFEILVNRYYRQILSYLSRLLNYNQGDAEDILQETFMNAYVNLVTYNPSLSFSSWLYRIAHNLAIDLIRKKSKSYNIDTNDQITQNQIHNDDYFIQEADEKAESAISIERLESILSRLDLETRNLLTMFYLQGLSLNEISDIFKTSSNTIAARLKRGREKAQKIISQLHL
jgi:RNA polymerase sigma-70 factor, ECF subfamily